MPVDRARAEVDAIRSFLERSGGKVLTGVCVTSVSATGELLDDYGNRVLSADAVILATHAPTARALLGDRAPAALAHFETTRSTVYLHRDPSCLPESKELWSSWNVSEINE